MIRKMAKTFADEEDFVKLQILNLAVKLFLTNPDFAAQTTVPSENALKIILSSKPKPALESKYCERDHFQHGSLSHFLNMRAKGYTDLPPFPAEAPDTTGTAQESKTSTANASGGAKGDVIAHTPQKQSHKKAHTPNDKNLFSESEKSSAYSESGSISSWVILLL